jgi:MoaA/NifB/PqqE/SkfB family radical SAM enzyme
MSTYIYKMGDEEFKVYDDAKVKTIASRAFNSFFDKRNGFFARWGATKEEDPQFCPIGPELLDIEVSIDGCPNKCAWCYKGNTDSKPTNMSFETFKAILDKMPKTLAQIAFGITGVQSNPDFVRMMEYTRACGVVPNFTLTGIDLTPELAAKCASLVGAVSVSVYPTDKNIGYDTIKTFTDLGVTQTNMHLMISEETMPFVYEVLEDRLIDERLRNMNAIVFLTAKPKGRAKGKYNAPSMEAYRKLIDFCFEREFAIGFDSCGASRFEVALADMKMPDAQRKQLAMCTESCESSLFSTYITVDGLCFPCSFSENEDDIESIDVTEAEDFLKDVWYSQAASNFRRKLMADAKNGCRFCPVYPEINP